MTTPRKRTAKPGEQGKAKKPRAEQPSQHRSRRALEKPGDKNHDLTTVASAFVKTPTGATPPPAPKVKPRKARSRASSSEVQSYESWEAKLSPREKRVDEIVTRMSQGAWLAGVSTREMAKQWNVTPSVVEQAAAEASRVLRRTLREGPEFQADCQVEVLQTFRVIRQMSMGIASNQNVPPSARVAALSNALQSTRLYGFYLGIEPTKGMTGQTAEVTVSEFDGWTTEQLDHYARTGKKPDTPGGGSIH